MLFFTYIQNQTPDRLIAPLTEVVRQGAYVDATFFAIEPSTEFRSAVTPKRLREIYGVKSQTHETADHQKTVTSFLLALKRSHLALLEPQKGEPWPGIDVRFGFAVADNVGHSILWMCTNGDGHFAMVDSRVYRLSGPVSTWFRSEGLRLLALKRAGKTP